MTRISKRGLSATAELLAVFRLSIHTHKLRGTNIIKIKELTLSRVYLVVHDHTICSKQIFRTSVTSMQSKLWISKCVTIVGPMV